MLETTATKVPGGGTTLRDCRLKRELTLTKAAAYLGCSAGNLSRIERGIQTVTIALARKLAALYGLSFEDVINAPPAPR